MRDPFTWSLEQRRRIVSDSVWFPLALMTAGLGNLLFGLNDWPWWTLVDLALFGVGGALLFRAWPRSASENTPS